MTQPRSRVDLYAAIRRDARSGMSNRALQRKHGVGFRTVTADPRPRGSLRTSGGLGTSLWPEAIRLDLDECGGTGIGRLLEAAGPSGR